MRFKFSSLPLLSMLISSAAFAHITMEANRPEAGGYAKLTFQVPHGCEGSSTTKVTVQIPEGVLSVKPQVHPNWTISMKTVKLKKPVELHGKPITETTSEVSWSGGPLPDIYMDEFAMSVLLPIRPGEAVFFPVIQECEKGRSAWVETNSKDSKLPAPSIQLKAPSKSEGHHH